MSFKVLIVSSMVGMLLPEAMISFKIKILFFPEEDNIFRSGFGVFGNRDKYYFDFCFESRRFHPAKPTKAKPNVRRECLKRMRQALGCS